MNQDPKDWNAVPDWKPPAVCVSHGDLLPGWQCCQCYAFNGEAKKMLYSCRSCGHVPCHRAAEVAAMTKVLDVVTKGGVIPEKYRMNSVYGKMRLYTAAEAAAYPAIAKAAGLRPETEFAGHPGWKPMMLLEVLRKKLWGGP